MLASPHPRQAERLAALRNLNILDTPREASYDEIVALVADICEAPIAVINLIDEDRQWFKAEIGLGVRETPLETSICSHVILVPGLTVIRDTRADPRMCDNALCLSTPNLRFYAGICLETDEGLPLGTLCVLDHKPRDLTELQRKALAVLARQVMVQIKLNLRLKESEALRQEIDHRVKNSLGLVQAVLTLQARQSVEPGVQIALEQARDRVGAVANVHTQLHRSGSATDVELDEFIALLTESLGSHAHSGVVLSSSVPAITVTARDASNIGLLVNELATNSLKHGFAEDRPGHILIEGEEFQDRVRITVRDNGLGLPSDFDPTISKGLGMRLALSLAKGFGGELQWGDVRDGAGTYFSFDFPIAAHR